MARMRKQAEHWLDTLLVEVDRGLKTLSHRSEVKAARPGADEAEVVLTDERKAHTIGLMRINHTGEVCAQALYKGQAMMAKDDHTRAHLLEAASEEQDHLNWCQVRLDELGGNPSVSNPFWYAHSFILGAVAAKFGDPVSYGFVVETERQVESHLQEHIEDIGESDKRSLRILQQMQADEIRHGENAKQAGGIELPQTVKNIMTAMSKFMKFVSYRV